MLDTNIKLLMKLIKTVIKNMRMYFPHFKFKEHGEICLYYI